MSDSPKRSRLAITYVPGQGCELDLALGDLVAHLGKPLRKGDIRELVILGSLAKTAGFTTAKEMSGRHVLIPMSASAVALAESTQASGRLATVPAAIAQPAAAGAKVEHPSGEHQAPTSSEIHERPGKAGASVESEAKPDRTRPVTVSARGNKGTSETHGEARYGGVKSSAGHNAESGISTVNPPSVTDSVTVSPLTPANEDSAEGADNGVMSLEEGTTLLEAALKF